MLNKLHYACSIHYINHHLFPQPDDSYFYVSQTDVLNYFLLHFIELHVFLRRKSIHLYF